jgi:hypothetical protein
MTVQEEDKQEEVARKKEELEDNNNNNKNKNNSNKTKKKRKMGLGAVDAETLKRIVLMGGKARAKDIESLREAGRLGGNMVKEMYGAEYYSQIGTKGSKTLIERYTLTYFTDLAAKSKAARKSKKKNKEKRKKKTSSSSSSP